MVFFDLPTDSPENRKAATEFREDLLRDGFTMFQFSVYTRHCASMENAQVHIKRIQRFIPANGHVSILCITDKQFGDMKIFRGQKKEKPKPTYKQLELF